MMAQSTRVEIIAFAVLLPLLALAYVAAMGLVALTCRPTQMQ